METKANHLAVGSFVLIMIAALFAFAVWLGRTSVDQEYDRYYIRFAASVSGLTTTSKVRYRGIPVGTVTDIRIDPEDSGLARVAIEVTRGTPIKEDSVAALELQGITGLVDVQISGGSNESPLLEPRPGEELAEIPSAPSMLESLFQDVPDVLGRIARVLERGQILLSDANLAAISETLQNIRSFSGALAASSEDIAALSADAAGTMQALRSSVADVSRLVAELRDRVPALLDDASTTLAVTRDTLGSTKNTVESIAGDAGAVSKDLRATLKDIGATAKALTETSRKLGALLEENRPAINNFASEGFYEFMHLMSEARALVGSMTLLVERLETDPAGFFLGGPEGGYEAQ